MKAFPFPIYFFYVPKLVDHFLLPVSMSIRSGSPSPAGLLLENFLISLTVFCVLDSKAEAAKCIKGFRVRSANLRASSVGCMLRTQDLASATIFLKLMSSLGSHSKTPCWSVPTGQLLHCLCADGKLLLGQSYDRFLIFTPYSVCKSVQKYTETE